MPAVYWITFLVNFLGLVLALWLGLYLVTRNPRYPIAWLTALTLWSMAGLFLNILLAINPPPEAVYGLGWMRWMFPFWPVSSLAGNTNSWLQGWSVTPAVALWHHVTVLMLPGRLTPWRWTRILIGYLLAILAVIVQSSAPILFISEASDPLYLNSMRPGIWYPFFGAALILLTGACVYNLLRSARLARAAILRKQLLVMATATLIAGLTGPLSIAGSALGASVPIVVMSLLVVVPVVVIGTGIVLYSALMHARTIRHDFFYSLAGLCLVILVYGLTSWVLVVVYQAPRVVLVFIPVLAVLTHTLMHPAYRLMDRLFYRRETRTVRSNLQQLIRQAGETSELQADLERVLEPLCASVSAIYGLILGFEGPQLRMAAGFRWPSGETGLALDQVCADDAVHLQPGDFRPPLEEAALLVPLYGEAEQIGSEQVGALILGRPANGLRYADDEVEDLLEASDRLGEILAAARRRDASLAQISVLAGEGADLVVKTASQLLSGTVEAALRNLDDYAYLADTELARLELVSSRLPRGPVTHLERGKQVHALLLETIEQLRPEDTPLREPPAREWYPYLILKDAYLEDRPNRDIMLDLYISEGTFNRTRRAAIRSVTRAIGEKEASLG